MNVASLPPEEITTLVDHFLKEKDPASVGLRRILKKKMLKTGDFPMRAFGAEEFSVPGKSGTVLSEEEKHVIELEQKLARLNETFKKQTENARTAIKAAYEKGFTEGRVQGHGEGKRVADNEYKKKIDAVQDRVGKILQKIEMEKRSVFSNADRLLLKLTNQIARKVVYAEITQRQEVVLSVIKKALTYIGDKEKIIVRVGRNDMETVSGNRDFWVPVGERLKDIVIEGDDRIEQGGCIIESNSGIVDARLGVQLDAITDIIEQAWTDIHTTNSGQG